MSPAPAGHRRAVDHLKRADPVMAGIIARVGPCRFGRRTDGSHFHHLARAIVSQQLSTRAARTIHERFVALYDGAEPDPSAVAATSDERLRGVGLSRQKASYIRDLARRVAAGELPLERIERLSDEEVITALTRVKGIGTWSAQMFLMFRLGRLDVLPVLDLGIRKAVRVGYRTRGLPSARRLERLARPWSPYATIACWYLWRSIDGPAA